MLDYAAIEKCLRDCVTSFLILFLKSKIYTRAPYEKAKTVSQNVLFSRRYSQKTCVRVVVDDFTTYSIYSYHQLLQSLPALISKQSKNQPARITAL